MRFAFALLMSSDLISSECGTIRIEYPDLGHSKVYSGSRSPERAGNVFMVFRLVIGSDKGQTAEHDKWLPTKQASAGIFHAAICRKNPHQGPEALGF
jgi:hypothetical protein